MKLFFCLSLLLLEWSIVSAETFVIAEKGRAQADILIPENAPFVVRFAAKELSFYLERITGAKFAVNPVKRLSGTIRLGFCNAADMKPDQYVIQVSPSRIDIYGKDDPSEKHVNLFNLFYDNPRKGTLRGIYAFLDKLGVRWPAPGPEHDFVPRRPDLSFASGNYSFTPPLADRQTADCWNFMIKYPDAKEYCRNVNDFYLWGLRLGVSTRNMVNGCHSERSLRLYETPQWLAHPERSMLRRDGRRDPRYSCWTDPEVKALWMRVADAYFSGRSPADIGLKLPAYLHSQWPAPFIAPAEIMIDPMDHDGSGDGRCYCARCQEFRKKYPCPDDTELIWSVIIDVARDVRKKHPGKFISTLVYPPKRLLPKTFKVPENIRVRICVSGPKEIYSPNRLAGELDEICKWSHLLGRENLPLWAYQCVVHGRTLTGPVETYPHAIAEYIRRIRPLTNGMFLENHALTHTYRNLDVYIFLRLMYNPDLDVEHELKDYFNSYYGPAAEPMRELFARFERNWGEIWRNTMPDKKNPLDSLGLWPKDGMDHIRRRIWSEIYSQSEMQLLESLLKQAENAARSTPKYAARTALVRKYIFTVMTAERSEIMNRADIRKNISATAPFVPIQSLPSAADFAKAPRLVLQSASRYASGLKAGGSFRAIHSPDLLYIRAELDEPTPANSATAANRKNGDPDVYKDNCVELFFSSPLNNKFHHIIINDRGVWSSQIRGRALSRWIQLPGLQARVEKTFRGWIMTAAIPKKELGIKDGRLYFNLTRERNIHGYPTEYSTWSPLGMLGNWHQVDCYGALELEQQAK